MGIAITHEQRELARSVRGWLGRVVPPEVVRKHLDVPGTATGRPAHWDAAAGQGLLGLHLPEAVGGGGGDLVDLAVVVEETARALLPGPYLPTVLAAELLHRAGHADLAAALAKGERIGAVGFTGTGRGEGGGPGPDLHPDAGPDPHPHPAQGADPHPHPHPAQGAGRDPHPAQHGASPAPYPRPTPRTPAPLTALRTPHGYLLDGAAPPVLGGGHADLVLLRAATADGDVWLAVDVD
ncbi:acyl-CoA dehydrogenase family protein, partial [Streptomyces sp. CBMA370]